MPDVEDAGSSSDPLTHRFGPAVSDDGTCFRLWAPGVQHLDLLIKDRPPIPMERSDDGFWSVTVAEAGAGTRYRFRIDDLIFPDPASRQQEADADGWSVVRKPFARAVHGDALRPWHESIICEVHIGTATPAGTFNAFRDRLEHYRDDSYTCLEFMPLNEFPGGRNWGYDGTLIFAPEAAYGTPDDLRALVDRAHQLDLGVILDVVYNHFGETDNFLERYAPEWFTEEAETPWGAGINFNQPMVRRFYYENAAMWLSEYDFDGLRFDSVHQIGTDSRALFLSELAQHARAAKPHAALIIENMDNAARWLERENNEPKTFTAQWNDDFHHVLSHLVTGAPKYGYDDPDKDPFADLEKALADGFVHDGEAYGRSDGKTRNEPASRLPPDCFIIYQQNHDQVGNSGDNTRLPDRISPEKLDFLYFVTFLAPQIPLFFMGEEANVRTYFPFFVDLPEQAAQAKRDERYRQMTELFDEDVPPQGLPDPNDPATFEMAKLDWEHFDTEEGRAALERFRTLMRFRKDMLWPLAKTPCRDARTARQGNGIIVTWEFEAGNLTMALNPQDVPADLDCTIDRKPVTTGAVSVNDDVLRLGPWSACAW